MAVKGFNIGGSINRYDFNSLVNKEGAVTADMLGSDVTTQLTTMSSNISTLQSQVATLNDGYTNLALQIDSILEAASVPTTATSYSCAWSDYDLLIIQSCFYSNVRESIVVTKGYFAVTSSTSRVMLYDNQSGGRIYEVYKNGTSAVYAAITTGSAGTASLNLKIYGVKLAK